MGRDESGLWLIEGKREEGEKKQREGRGGVWEMRWSIGRKERWNGL